MNATGTITLVHPIWDIMGTRVGGDLAGGTTALAVRIRVPRVLGRPLPFYKADPNLELDSWWLVSWAVSGVLLNMVGQGMVLSYPSCLLPGLMHPESEFDVDLSTASWLASSVGLAALLGFFVSSFFMEIYGRKLAHALVILPGTIGWATIHFAQDIPTLMIGRVLGGITGGATVTLGAIVIGEFTSPEHRGMFLNLKTAAVCFGNTVVHVLGHYYNWRTVALFGIAPHTLAFFIVCTWPESPAWLASKKQYEESEKAFIWLRGSSEQSKKEHNLLVKAQKSGITAQDQSFAGKIVAFIKRFGRKDFMKPCIIMVFAAILMESCGRHVFPAYASSIIGEITGDKTQSFLYTICIDFIITTSAVSSSVLVKIMKRRTLLFASGISSLGVLFCVCLYLFLVSRSIIPRENTWMPISMLIAYFILVNLGCTPITFGLLGEIFPLAHRGASSAVSGITLSVFLMIPLKITPYLLTSVGLHGTFTVFGVAMVVSLLALNIMLPETKDKTLQEIEDFFNYGKFKNNKSVAEDEDVKLKMLS